MPITRAGPSEAAAPKRIRVALQAAGCTVYAHAAVPANDGGLALGQAAVAAAHALRPL